MSPECPQLFGQISKNTRTWIRSEIAECIHFDSPKVLCYYEPVHVNIKVTRHSDGFSSTFAGIWVTLRVCLRLSTLHRKNALVTNYVTTLRQGRVQWIHWAGLTCPH